MIRWCALAVSLCIAVCARAQSIDEVSGLLRDLSARTSDLSVLFGVPTDEDVERVRSVSRHVLDAEPTIDAALLREIEDAEPDGPFGHATDEAERAYRVLVRRRSEQLPLHAARARVLLAAVSRDRDTRADLLRDAVGALSELSPRSGWGRAERAVLLGYAALMSGRTQNGLEAFDGAAEFIAGDDALVALLGAEVTLARATAVSALEGWNAGVRTLRTAIDGPPFVVDGERDAALALSAIDAEFVITRRGTDTARAMRVYEHALWLDDTAMDAESWRARVYARVLRTQEGDAIDASLPPVVALALGRRLASDGDERGIAALRALVAREDESVDRVRALARLELARAQLRLGKRNEAAAQLRAIVEQSPDHPSAREAVTLAMSLRSGEDVIAVLRAVHEERVSVEDPDGARAVLVWALGGLYDGTGDDRLLSEAMSVAGSIRDVERMESAWVSVLGHIIATWPLREELSARAQGSRAVRAPAGDRLSIMSEALRVRILLDGESARDAIVPIRKLLVRMASFEAPIQRLCARVPIEALRQHAFIEVAEAAYDASGALDANVAESLRRAIARFATSPVRSASHDFPEDAPMAYDFARAAMLFDRADLIDRPNVESALAWSLLLSGDGERALEIFERTWDTTSTWGEDARGYGEALLATGLDERAFAHFREMAQRYEHRTGVKHYWHAWVRMLEMLEQRNGDGARTQTILREINRLRRSEFWGQFPRCVDRLESIERRLTR